MTNLIENLRAMAQGEERSRFDTQTVCAQAAEEIEVLREALQLIAEGTYTQKGAEDWAKFVLTERAVEVKQP